MADRRFAVGAAHGQAHATGLSFVLLAFLAVAAPTQMAGAQAPTPLPRPGVPAPAQKSAEPQAGATEAKPAAGSTAEPAASHALLPTDIAPALAKQSACVVLRSTALDGEQAITMRNGCDHPVTALGCFRVLRPGGNIQKPGWYCVLAPEFKRKDPITLSRGAIYHPGFKRAGCGVTEEQCSVHLQRIAFNVYQSQVDPDKFDEVLR